MGNNREARKNEIAQKLTDLAREESQLLINRRRDQLITWSQYEQRTKEIDAERITLRKELFELCKP